MQGLDQGFKQELIDQTGLMDSSKTPKLSTTDFDHLKSQFLQDEEVIFKRIEAKITAGQKLQASETTSVKETQP